MTEADRAENQKAIEELVHNPPRPRKTWMDWLVHGATAVVGVIAIVALCIAVAATVANESKAKCTKALSETARQQAVDINVILTSTDRGQTIIALKDFEAQSVTLASACV